MHTTGPWYEGKTGNHQGLILDEKTGANIAVTYDKAHAPLVAAAPELLEALKEARSYAALKLEGYRRDYSEDHCIVQTPLRLLATIDAVIAKADGRD